MASRNDPPKWSRKNKELKTFSKILAILNCILEINKIQTSYTSQPKIRVKNKGFSRFLLGGVLT